LSATGADASSPAPPSPVGRQVAHRDVTAADERLELHAAQWAVDQLHARADAEVEQHHVGIGHLELLGRVEGEVRLQRAAVLAAEIVAMADRGGADEGEVTATLEGRIGHDRRAEGLHCARGQAGGIVGVADAGHELAREARRAPAAVDVPDELGRALGDLLAGLRRIARLVEVGPRRVVGLELVVEDPQLELDPRLVGIDYEKAFVCGDRAFVVPGGSGGLRVFQQDLGIVGLAQSFLEGRPVGRSPRVADLREGWT
jgi:hypothetical protein